VLLWLKKKIKISPSFGTKYAFSNSFVATPFTLKAVGARAPRTKQENKNLVIGTARTSPFLFWGAQLHNNTVKKK
jgi:hypothetical protein